MQFALFLCSTQLMAALHVESHDGTDSSLWIRFFCCTVAKIAALPESEIRKTALSQNFVCAAVEVAAVGNSRPSRVGKINKLPGPRSAGPHMLYKNEQTARLEHLLYFTHASLNIGSTEKQRGDHGVKLPFCKRHFFNIALIKRKILPGPPFKFL